MKMKSGIIKLPRTLKRGYLDLKAIIIKPNI